jgi:hypothetical protein
MSISRFINTLLLCLTFLAFAAQFAIDFSTENIAASSIILIGAISTLLYLRWTESINTHPLSTFTLFGFCVTSLLGALLAQSLAWTSVSANLRQPLLTFPALVMYLAIALLAHAFYRVITATSKPGLVRYTFQSVGVYATPSPLNLWIIGGLGFFGILLSKYSAVAHGLSIFAWAPFLIPIYLSQTEGGGANSRKNYMLLAAFAILIALMAMAFNARGMMLSGLITLALLFLLVGMRNQKPITNKILVMWGVLVLLAAAVSWPASNMIIAMEAARVDRGKISGIKMVENTLENFQNPEKLESYREIELAKSLRSSYDETYIDNPLMKRFVITKFHDSAIYYAGKISDKNADEVMGISEDFFLSTLPQPWLDWLKIDVDKNSLYFSMGDVLSHYAVATPLGGERTGSMFGQGWVLFGYLFPIIYFVMCLILFASLDIFSIQNAVGVVTLSVIGMLNIWSYFLFGITADSLHALFMSVFRGIPQSVFLYAILFFIATRLSNLWLKMMHTKSTEILD